MTHTAQALDTRSRIGMWVFLASEVMFFGPVFAAYLYGRYAMPQAFEQASRSTDLVSGTVNTALLLSSSLAIALAHLLAEQGARKAACRALNITLLLGGLFLVVKGHEYFNDWREHLIPGAKFQLDDSPNQAGAQLFYFVYFFSTLLHALHLTIGMGLIAFCRKRLLRSFNPNEIRRLDITALYWHFVDIIWIFLFPALYLVGRSG